MVLSKQESRCAATVCRHLSEQTNREWTPDTWLDLARDTECSLDVLLSDGVDKIALEITQLTAGRRFESHSNAKHSLYRKLAPDRTRTFTLSPPPTLELPLHKKLIRSLKDPIKTAADSLRLGGRSSVLIPRRATIKYLRPNSFGYIFCHHADDSHLCGVERWIDGIYRLEDGGSPHHRFVTEQRLLEFREDLVRVCHARKQTGQATINWREEWPIHRGRDSTEGKGGVFLTSVTAGFLEVAAIESVDKAIQHAKAKFQSWTSGIRKAAALDASNQRGHLSIQTFEWAIERPTVSDIAPLDAVFLVGDDEVQNRRDFGG